MIICFEAVMALKQFLHVVFGGSSQMVKPFQHFNKKLLVVEIFLLFDWCHLLGFNPRSSSLQYPFTLFLTSGTTSKARSYIYEWGWGGVGYYMAMWTTQLLFINLLLFQLQASLKFFQRKKIEDAIKANQQRCW